MVGSASSSLRSGLCIDIPTLRINQESSDLPQIPPAAGHQTYRASVANIFPQASPSAEQPTVARTHSDASHDTLSRPPISELNVTLRSVRGMQGLLLAENGGGLVEFDPLGGGSGFKQGTRVMPGMITPRGGAFGIAIPASAWHQNGQELMPSKAVDYTKRLNRHGTLLSQGVTPARNAAELKSLLGNSRSKVKSGATVLPPPKMPSDRDSAAMDAPAVALEQGKSRARVEVDILLDSEVCVEGCYLTGKLHVKIKKMGAKDPPVFLAGGKMRVVGFEGIPDNNERHTFYQHSASLSAISASSHVLYVSPPDEEGFSRAREGMHVIPFAMKLPVSDGIHVGAKGPFDSRSGMIVKYIAIASIKLKDNTMSKRSIAHFYRSCEVYPYLNASIVMAPATHPLLSTAARSLFLGGTGKLKLTASLHRNVWVAGQRCCVGIAVHNESKKNVKGLILSLIRTTIVFHPHPHLDVGSPNSADPDACQTTTTRKLVAETTLEAGQRGLRGHVTAKGWWTGVEPGARMNFAHFILLPPDALSIVRSRLLEVQYAIRVSLVAGSLASEVSVMLPVRIVNHLSIDPPPSYPTPFGQQGIPVPPLPLPVSHSTTSTPPAFPLDTNVHEADKGGRPGRGRLASIFDGSERSSGASAIPRQAVSVVPGPLASHIPLPSLAEEDPKSDHLSNLQPEDLHDARDEPSELQEIREDAIDYCHEHEGDDTMRLGRESADDNLGNFSTEDSDEEVDFVVGSARLKDDDQSVTRFTDLHVENEQETLHVPKHPMESTVSSRSTYSMPSAEDHLSEEPISKELPSQLTMHETLAPAAQSCPKQRFKTPNPGRGLSGSTIQVPKPSPPRSYVAYSAQMRSRPNALESTRLAGFPFTQKSITSPSYQTSFSQRVERLVAARRAPVPSMTSDSSDGDGTPGLSTEGTGTQTDTSEMSPSSSPTISIQLTSANHTRLRKYTSTFSKMPVPARPASASQVANSVRSRIAELEEICKTSCVSDASSTTSARLNSYDMRSVKPRRSPGAFLSNVDDTGQEEERQLSYKASLLRYATGN